LDFKTSQENQGHFLNLPPNSFRQDLENMYAIVDIETTGGYAGYHRVTEVAVYHHDGTSITNSFQTLINPGRSIPYFITGLTGIDYQMVKDAPTFSEIADEIFSWLNGRVFVAHNAHFDYSFLKKEFEDAGIAFTNKKLCTVRLSRKIIPGLRSYGLGRLAESLGIEISNRHRAAGDAEATAKIFDVLIKRDSEGAIAAALKRNSGETILPPNLSRAEFDRLPAKAGVYYFHDGNGKVIYVGKAINIKKRIAGHFTGDAREWNRSNIRNEIAQISYELTGTELIALILEAQEIKRLWPKYNLAQKNKIEEWGIYDYEDRNGYIRFSITLRTRGSVPLISFTSKGDAWNFMWEKVRENKLCSKLCGLQKTAGACYEHQGGNCSGACLGLEDPSIYNQRVSEAIVSISENTETLAIVGRGRSADEQSLVLVEKGIFLGYGYVDKSVSVSTLEEAKLYIKPGKENRVAQNVVNSFLVSARASEIISFDVLAAEGRENKLDY
jgi:DNA polymerase III subunit epsilon